MRRLAVLTVATELAFLAVVLAVDLRTADPLARSISDGVHGPDGRWLTAAFVLHAVSLGALAALTRSKVRAGLIAAALGMLIAAAFPTGGGMSGPAHAAGAYLAFGGVAFAALAGPRRGAMGLLHAAVPVTTLAMAGALAVDADAWLVLERVQVFVNGAWILAMLRLGPRNAVGS